MSERTETTQLVVTNAGDVEYTFLFQAVDGKVFLSYEVRTNVDRGVKLKVFAPVALTIEEAGKFAHQLEYMADEARGQAFFIRKKEREQKEKTK